MDAEVAGFEFAELFFILLELFYLVIDSLFYLLSLLLFHPSIVLCVEVCRAYILGIMQVFAEIAECIYIVTPNGCVIDGIMVTDADFHGCPIEVNVPISVLDELSGKFVIASLYKCLGLGICQQGLEEGRRQGTVEIPVKAVTFQFGDGVILRIDTASVHDGECR